MTPTNTDMVAIIIGTEAFAGLTPPTEIRESGDTLEQQLERAAAWGYRKAVVDLWEVTDGILPLNMVIDSSDTESTGGA